MIVTAFVVAHAEVTILARVIVRELGGMGMDMAVMLLVLLMAGVNGREMPCAMALLDVFVGLLTIRFSSRVMMLMVMCVRCTVRSGSVCLWLLGPWRCGLYVFREFWGVC